MEQVYIQWLQAMRQKDLARWSAATSRYRQMCLRNQVVSLKQPWPNAIFQSFFRPPDLTKLLFVDASASGAAARLVYFGRVDFGFVEGEITPENPLMLHFLNEDGAWKFNTLQYVNLGKRRRPQTRNPRREAAPGWIAMTSCSTPSPRHPHILPRALSGRHHLRPRLRAAAPKSRSTDGPHQKRIENTSAEHVIIGGLRKGANKVTVRPTLRPIGHPGPPELEIIVMARTGNPARPTARLLAWKIPD